MSIEITTAFVQQYSDNIMMLSQQKGSRLRNAVMVESGIVGKSKFIDQFGSTSAQLKTTRHGDTPIISTPFARRKIDLSDYHNSDLIDNLDKVRMLADPTSPTSQAIAASMGRAQDDVIIAAFFGTAYTGETGSTSTTFPAANQVAVNYDTTTSLTISKLIEAKRILLAGEVDPDEEMYVAYSPKQLSNLLATTQVTSSDYNSVKALVEGKVDTFMGFKFILSNRLSTDGSGYRRIPVWAKSGMALGIGQDIVAKIAEDPSKNFSYRVYYEMAIGATRLEEAKVVEIKCAE